MFDDYQREALRTTSTDKPTLEGLAMASMGLAGEAGEVVDYIKKHLFHGHALERDKVCKELGDVLWYLAVLAHMSGLSLTEVAVANVAKLRKRYPDGFSTTKSINRTE